MLVLVVGLQIAHVVLGQRVMMLLLPRRRWRLHCWVTVWRAAAAAPVRLGVAVRLVRAMWDVHLPTASRVLLVQLLLLP